MKFRVLHLIGSNGVGGPEKQILYHARDMMDSEYEIEVGSFHDAVEEPEILVAAKAEGLLTICLSGGAHAGLVKELSAVLAARPGALLCTHGFKANVVGYFAAKRTGTRHIAFVRGWTAETLKVRVYEVIERFVLARAQWVVCVSRKQAGLVTRSRKNRSKPVVIQNAMLPPYTRLAEAVVSRDALKIAPGTVVFGSVGRLSAEKGHRYLIKAFCELCKLEPAAPLMLIVVGEGRERAALENQAKELGIGGRILFAGFQGSCTEWMRLLDCMVQPSLTEGTPNSVLEALCLRVPVVATEVGGVPDLIMDEENGLLVPPADPHALAAAMRRVALSPELRRKLAGGAGAILREYSPETQRQKLIAMYEVVLQGQARPLELAHG